MDIKNESGNFIVRFVLALLGAAIFYFGPVYALNHFLEVGPAEQWIYYWFFPLAILGALTTWGAGKELEKIPQHFFKITCITLILPIILWLSTSANQMSLEFNEKKLITSAERNGFYLAAKKEQANYDGECSENEEPWVFSKWRSYDSAYVFCRPIDRSE